MNSIQSSVIVDVQSFEQTKFNLVIGIIAFQFNGYYFPSEKWYDFPVRLLGCWLEETSLLFEKKKGLVNLPFMDGPYQLRLEDAGQNILEAECIERSIQIERCVCRRTLVLRDFLNDIVLHYDFKCAIIHRVSPLPP